MNKQTKNTMLMIAGAVMAVCALILLMVTMFGETKDNRSLYFAITAVVISSILNLIRIRDNRKSGK